MLLQTRFLAWTATTATTTFVKIAVFQHKLVDARFDAFFRRYSLLAEACFFVLVLILVVSVFLTTRFGRSSLRLGSRSCSRWFSACISTLASRRLGSRFGSCSFCV